ncbi:MAG: FG-GAP repeat protein [Planctomycetes bacterium]|nr:FG-GAP repeat protein [Planctomycetota bacterium]
MQGQKPGCGVLRPVSRLMAAMLACWLCPGVALGQCEDAKLTPTAGANADDFFGRGVAVSGRRALVGAHRYDNGRLNSGAAFIFEPGVPGWTQRARLEPLVLFGNASFGSAVALDGDTALIGAMTDGQNGQTAGAAYVFRFDGSGWVQQAKLLPGDPQPGDWFGVSAGLSGDWAIVGTPFSDDHGTSSGSAYIFHFDGVEWSEHVKLLAPDAAAQDEFGHAVAMEGDLALVGAYKDDDNGLDSGSVYVYRLSAGAWVFDAKLTASDGAENDWFGFNSISVHASAAVIGASLDDDRGSNSGSAYVFRRVNGQWSEEAKLVASDGQAHDNLGKTVAISGQTILAGARLDDDRGRDAGAVYVFTRTSSGWEQRRKVYAFDALPGDEFSRGIGLDADLAVVGAHRSDANGLNSGAAYVLHIDQCLVCMPDCDGSGALDIFDFLCFQNSFVLGESYACDCDPDPACDIFDFLCFQNAFVSGCP